jgi:hypothetical protein
MQHNAEAVAPIKLATVFAQPHSVEDCCHAERPALVVIAPAGSQCKSYKSQDPSTEEEAIHEQVDAVIDAKSFHDELPASSMNIVSHSPDPGNNLWLRDVAVQRCSALA